MAVRTAFSLDLALNIVTIGGVIAAIRILT
jgi:hypothetical protein